MRSTLKKRILIIISFLSIIFNSNIYSQGCSDAGFCTIHNIQPSIEDSIDYIKSNQLIVGFSNGIADYDISILSANIEYLRQVNEYFGLDVKLSFMSQSGNNINNGGFSDVYINAAYLITNGLKIIAGTKYPLNKSTDKKDGLALPMDYQSSLGTWDLIFGVGYEYSYFKFILAMQQPLTQNKNSFYSHLYPAGSKIREFQSTNKFKRSGDLLFRISYPQKFYRNLTLTYSILPIYHLANDEFTNITGIEKEIGGSQGLTFNVNLYLDYALDETNFIELNFGMPLLTRDSRPDGLTRGYVLSLEYKTKF